MNKIKEEAPNFPEDQEPILSDRDKNISAGRIMLHPLGNAPPSREPSLCPDAAGRTVTLVLDFDDKPALEDIEKLGQQMNQIFEDYTLGVNRVRWASMNRNASAHSVRKIRDIVNRKRRAGERGLPNSGLTQPEMDIDLDLADLDEKISRDSALDLSTPFETSVQSTARPGLSVLPPTTHGECPLLDSDRLVAPAISTPTDLGESQPLHPDNKTDDDSIQDIVNAPISRVWYRPSFPFLRTGSQTAKLRLQDSCNIIGSCRAKVRQSIKELSAVVKNFCRPCVRLGYHRFEWACVSTCGPI